MLKIKYIISDGRSIIVFPETIEHKDFKHLNPTSAGFIYYTAGKFICHGESVTLGLRSNPETDSSIANKQLINHSF